VPVRVFELFESRNRKPDGTTLRYVITGTNDYDAARSSLLSTAPTTLGTWSRRPDETINFQGHQVHIAEVNYGPVLMGDRPALPNPFPPSGGSPPPPPPPPPAEDDAANDELTFDISSVNRRLYYSEETRHRIHRFPLNQLDTPNFKRLVGVNGKSVEGYDRIEPNLEFTITKEFESVPYKYVDRLAELIGTINQADFLPYGKAEELLLMGVSGRCGGRGKDKSRPRLNFRFGKRKNRINAVITTDAAGNNDIVAPTVKGWDHIWILYEQETGGQTITTQRALAAYVERIYPRSNFANLGIYS
jgi:hypothetical protein